MENIQNAILSAIEAKPLDFKAHIEKELESKVYANLQDRKIELAKTFINKKEDSEEIRTDIEDTADEEL